MVSYFAFNKFCCPLLHKIFLLTTDLIFTTFLCLRFDEMRQGEPARKIHGKKRAFRDNNDVATHDMVRKSTTLSCLPFKMYFFALFFLISRDELLLHSRTLIFYFVFGDSLNFDPKILSEASFGMIV